MVSGFAFRALLPVGRGRKESGSGQLELPSNPHEAAHPYFNWK